MQETLKERQEYLFLVADNLIEERRVWSEDNSLEGLPVGGPLWMAAELAVETFASGTIPASCRNLCRAVEEFAKHWKDHTSRAEVSGIDNLLPGNNVFSALDVVVDVRTGSSMRVTKTIETVAELVKQNVTPIQIAKIYEWLDDNGNGDVAKVRDAINNPGKYDGEEHVKAMQEKERKRQELARMQAARMRQRIDGRRPTAPNAGPESIELLVAQGLNAAQISKVKLVSIEEVVRYCRERRIELTPKSGQSDEPSGNERTQTHVEHFDESFNDGDAGSLGDLDDEFLGNLEGDEVVNDTSDDDGTLTLEEQIIFHADANPDSKAGDIAKMLDTSPQKVAAVLRRRSEIEQTV